MAVYLRKRYTTQYIQCIAMQGVSSCILTPWSWYLVQSYNFPLFMSLLFPHITMMAYLLIKVAQVLHTSTRKSLGNMCQYCLVLA